MEFKSLRNKFTVFIRKLFFFLFIYLFKALLVIDFHKKIIVPSASLDTAIVTTTKTNAKKKFNDEEKNVNRQTTRSLRTIYFAAYFLGCNCKTWKIILNIFNRTMYSLSSWGMLCLVIHESSPIKYLFSNTGIGCV